ncbi:GNAT family N-acetyltransferase [Acidobacteriota bacterium]
MSTSIIDVTAENVDKTGFFCFMSRRKSEGFQRKLEWVKARFSDGMHIKMFELPERGFIEYIPGQHAWRAVNSNGYMFIHCLWVVGKSKGKGLGGILLEECIRDAEEAGMAGVAMITSESNWLTGNKLLLKSGFESVDFAPPAFNLMVRKFKDFPSPSFLPGVEKRAEKYQQGLTVFHSDQCPYIPDAVDQVKKISGERGIPFQVIELLSAEDARMSAPSPYGVFSIVFNGRMLSYHYLLPKDLNKRLDEIKEKGG